MNFIGILIACVCVVRDDGGVFVDFKSNYSICEYFFSFVLEIGSFIYYLQFVEFIEVVIRVNQANVW